MPAAIYGRTADNWRPLLAVADVAGDEWRAPARRAAEVLSAGRAEQTAGIMLLEDIRRVFADRAVDRIKSEELANVLADLEDRPWPEWKNDKRITARQVAKLLEPFEIRPGPVRFPEKVLKGYHLHQFDEAFGRYLPSEPVTPLQASKSAALGATISVTPGDDVTDQDAPQPLKSVDCNGVTDQAPEGWEGDL
jgi:putative DNA primase/helicase